MLGLDTFPSKATPRTEQWSAWGFSTLSVSARFVKMDNPGLKKFLKNAFSLKNKIKISKKEKIKKNKTKNKEPQAAGSELAVYMAFY